MRVIFRLFFNIPLASFTITDAIRRLRRSKHKPRRQLL